MVLGWNVVPCGQHSLETLRAETFASASGQKAGPRVLQELLISRRNRSEHSAREWAHALVGVYECPDRDRDLYEPLDNKPEPGLNE